MEINTNSKTNLIKENDLVLSLPEDMINFQFKKLCDQQKLAGQERITKWNVETEYGLELHANIRPPKIRILEGKRDTIQLRIQVIDGTMTYWEGFGPKAIEHKTSIAGFLYVFDCEIGSIPTKFSKVGKENQSIISKETAEQVKDKVEETKEYVESIIKKVGDDCELKPLSDENFTIESILMDFQKSNIANFNVKESKIDLEGEALLQFTNLVTHALRDEPYILGHVVTIESRDSEDGLFAPTGLNYSTSYKDETKDIESSIDLIMMTGGKQFSKDADALILSNGLVKKNNEGSETRPVLAVNYDLFYNMLYKNVVSDCKSLVEKELKDILKMRDNSKSGFWDAYNGKRKSYTYKGKDGDLVKNSGEESKFIGEKGYGYHSDPDWNYKVNAEDTFAKVFWVDKKEQSENTTFKVAIDITEEMNIVTTIFISTESYYMHDKTLSKTITKKEKLDNYDDAITITIQINPASEGMFQFEVFDNISKLTTSQNMFKNSVSRLTKDYTNKIKDMVKSLEDEYQKIFDIPLFNDTVIFPFGKVYKYKGLYRYLDIEPKDNIVYSKLSYISKPTTDNLVATNELVEPKLTEDKKIKAVAE